MPRDSHRQKLLEGALECLRSKGYAETTTRDIATAAGASIGSIGYHYGSKQALLNEALLEGFRAWTTQISRRVSSIDSSDPLERLRLSWETMTTQLEENQGLLQAFLEALAPATRSPQLKEQLASFYRDTREDVATVVQQSLGNDPRAATAGRVIASLLIALSDGLQLQWFLQPEETPTAQEIADAAGIAAGVLLASAGHDVPTADSQS